MTTNNEKALAGLATDEGHGSSRYQRGRSTSQSTPGQPPCDVKAQLFPHGSGPLRLGALTDAERLYIEAAELLRQAEQAVR